MKKSIALLLCALLWALCAGACAEVFLSQPPEGWTQDVLRITAFPVGEGDAMLIECGGEAMMLDGGPNPFRDMLMAEMDERGIRHMRYIVNTHYHDDHINGLYHLMKNGYTADSYLHPYSDFYVKKDKLQSRTVEMAKRRGMAVGRLFDGDERTLGTAHIRFYRYTEINNANAKSLVTRITFGHSSALLCADIIGKTQEYFTANLAPEELKADVMKIPHHGITPVNSGYLDAVDPDFAIVTNYQKDVSKIITQLEGRGIPACYSADGAVILETDGTDWYVWQEIEE